MAISVQEIDVDDRIIIIDAGRRCSGEHQSEGDPKVHGVRGVQRGV